MPAITTGRLPRTATLARHHDLQERLLAAAEAAIAGGGLETLRARDLAQQVGCSLGAIYGVYPDLDALIMAVNCRTLAAIDDAMREAVPTARPKQRLVKLATAYLDYASGHRRRWNALFQHRMPNGRAVSASYAAQQRAAFSHIEAPLHVLRPDLPAAECALLARTLFSAVHGMVALGLDEKIAPVRPAVLRGQIRIVVKAMADGLAHARAI